MDPAGMAAEAGDQELAADGIRALAVHALAGFRTGRGQAEPLGIGRGGDVPGTLHGTVQITADLVHPHDEQDFLRALADGGDAVGVSVNVHEDTVVCHGVHTGKEDIRVIGGQHGGPLIFHSIPINEMIIAVFDGLHQANFMSAHGAAHGDGAVFRNQAEGELQGFFL